MQTLEERLIETKSKVKINSKVSFLRDGARIHNGIVVQVSEWGCRIFNPIRSAGNYDSHPDFAEWYPFKTPVGGIVLT